MLSEVPSSFHIPDSIYVHPFRYLPNSCLLPLPSVRSMKDGPPCLFYPCRGKHRAWQSPGFNVYQQLSSFLTSTVVCLRESERVEGRERVREGKSLRYVGSGMLGTFWCSWLCPTLDLLTRPPYLSKLRFSKKQYIDSYICILIYIYLCI